MKTLDRSAFPSGIGICTRSRNAVEEWPFKSHVVKTRTSRPSGPVAPPGLKPNLESRHDAALKRRSSTTRLEFLLDSGFTNRSYDFLEPRKWSNALGFHALVGATGCEVLVFLRTAARPVNHQSINLVSFPQAKS